MGTLSFSISGEWFTNFIRDRFIYEGVPYAKTEEMLLAGMEGTDLSKDTLRRMAQDVLLGRSEMVGNTADGTYRYRETGVVDNRIFELIDRLLKQRDEAREDLRVSQEMWMDLAEAVSEGRSIRDCAYEQNRDLRPRDELEKLLDDIVAGPGDAGYGFISPDGDFFPVEFGDHSKWAREHLEENGLTDAFEAQLVEALGNGQKRFTTELDYLIHRLGWILMHNPGNGRPIATLNESRAMPKRQQEALYDYYIKAGMPEKANEFFKES